MPAMKINGMSLSAYSDYMKEKHGHKKFEKYKRNQENSYYEGSLEPCTFEEAMQAVIKGHELIQGVGR